MSEGLAEDGVCVTDGHPSYAMASRSLNMHQEGSGATSADVNLPAGVGISTRLTSVTHDHEAMAEPSPPRDLYTLPEPLHALVDAIGIQA